MPLQAESRQFEDRKIAAGGVHFLAIQKSPEEESFAGFWLLLDVWGLLKKPASLLTHDFF